MAIAFKARELISFIVWVCEIEYEIFVDQIELVFIVSGLNIMRVSRRYQNNLSVDDPGPVFTLSV